MTERRTMTSRILRHMGAGAAMLSLTACAGWTTGMGEPVARPGTAAEAYEAGKDHLQAGRLGLALEAFEEARRGDPASVAVLNGLGAVYDRMGRHVQAEQAYLEALAVAPNDPMTLNNIGWSRHLRGQGAVAAFYLARAVELAPGDPVMQANLLRVENGLAATPSEPPAVELREAHTGPRLMRRSITEQMLITAALPPARLPGLIDEEDVLERQAHALTAAAPPAPSPDAGRPDAAGQEEAAAWEAAPSLPAPNSPMPARLSGVEVSNGTGRDRMATRFAAWLAERHVDVIRRTNAEHFRHHQTVLSYRPETGADAAHALAARLPHPVEVRAATPEQTSPLRLTLGADFLDFDHQLVADQRSSPHA